MKYEKLYYSHVLHSAATGPPATKGAIGHPSNRGQGVGIPLFRGIQCTGQGDIEMKGGTITGAIKGQEMITEKQLEKLLEIFDQWKDLPKIARSCSVPYYVQDGIDAVWEAIKEIK